MRKTLLGMLLALACATAAPAFADGHALPRVCVSPTVKESHNKMIVGRCAQLRANMLVLESLKVLTVFTILTSPPGFLPSADRPPPPGFNPPSAEAMAKFFKELARERKRALDIIEPHEIFEPPVDPTLSVAPREIPTPSSPRNAALR